MPVYKHSVTGAEQELAADYAEKGFPPGTWTKLKDEGPNEEAERLQQEAIANKVELVLDDEEYVPPVVDEKYLEAERSAVVRLNEEAAGTAQPKKKVPAKAAKKEGE